MKLLDLQKRKALQVAVVRRCCRWEFRLFWLLHVYQPCRSTCPAHPCHIAIEQVWFQGGQANTIALDQSPFLQFYSEGGRRHCGTPSAGAQRSGQWRTSGAKEYPPELNRGLALAVLDSLRLHVRRGHLRQREWASLDGLLPWVEEVTRMSANIRAAHFLPDYQGQ